MDKIRILTKFFIIITLAVILIYDVYAVLAGGTRSTISQVMAEWTVEWAPLTHLLMFLMGHMVWPMYVNIDKKDR